MDDPARIYWILDAHGEPIPARDFVRWALWFETADRRIARDTIGPCTISTVFLGIDHGWGRGRAVLFETMIFGGLLDGDSTRYTTRPDALAGHAGYVAAVQAITVSPHRGP